MLDYWLFPSLLDFLSEKKYYLTMSTEVLRPMTFLKPKRRSKKYMPPLASLKNLIPYKPGENGHGRVYPLKERLYHALDKPLKEPKADAPVGEHLVYKTLKGALDLVPAPFHETWDRVEGKVPDKRDVTFNGEGLSDILMKLRGYNPQALPEGEEER